MTVFLWASLTGTDRRLSRMFVLLVAVLALSWQSFITQTHRHWPEDMAPVHVAAGAHLKPGVAPFRPAPDLPANCPICREIYHAGTFLLPPDIAIPQGLVAPVWLFLALALALTRQTRSHGWNSRAPPLPQA